MAMGQKKGANAMASAFEVSLRVSKGRRDLARRGTLRDTNEHAVEGWRVHTRDAQSGGERKSGRWVPSTISFLHTYQKKKTQSRSRSGGGGEEEGGGVSRPAHRTEPVPTPEMRVWRGAVVIQGMEIQVGLMIEAKTKTNTKL